MYIVDKDHLPLWEEERDKLLENIKGHRLEKNYSYDYYKADEVTMLVEGNEAVAIACMVRWNDVATRVMYRWMRDRSIKRQDHVYGELSRTVLDHQLSKVTTPYAFVGLDGNRQRLITKWADAAGWSCTSGLVFPNCRQWIAYTQLEDTDEPFDPLRLPSK